MSVTTSSPSPTSEDLRWKTIAGVARMAGESLDESTFRSLVFTAEFIVKNPERRSPDMHLLRVATDHYMKIASKADKAATAKGVARDFYYR